MIFPEECKSVGSAATKPNGDTVYFLTKYLVHPLPEGGYEILEVRQGEGEGFMRPVESLTLLAGPEDIHVWQGSVSIHNRAGLVGKALSTGRRCTLFGEKDEHMTFVCDPDLSGFATVHVYDITPPRANLSETIRILEELGFFEYAGIQFAHHVRDIAGLHADIYPCRAGGFARTLDRDRPAGGEHVACCLTGRQICAECYGEDFAFEDTCPLSQIADEPFIARCCRAERSGIGVYNGRFGAVVHWGSSPRTMLNAVDAMLKQWKERAM
jgi:hypothetical protein